MGCFSAPKTKFVTPIDPNVRSGIFDPLTSQLAGQIFGTPANTSTTVTNPGLLQWLLGDRSARTTTTIDNPAVAGAFSGAPATWAYPGQRVAPASDLQFRNFDWASQLPGNVNMYQRLASQATDRAAQPMNWDALTGQAQNLWNRTIMPSILNQQSGMDAAGSGGTADALARAGSDLSSNLFAQMAPLELQARNQQLQAGLQYQNIGNMPLNAMQSLSMLGGEQRGIGQQQLAGQQELWAAQQPWNHPLMQYVFPTIQAGQQTGVQQPAGMGYSLASALAAPLVGTLLGGPILGGMVAMGQGMGRSMT